MENVIELQNIYKKYRKNLKSLKGIAGYIFNIPSSDDFWALNNISLNVKPREILGIIGPNGAGKSTILKILANVTKPTRGKMTVNGTIGPLIEIGAGFQPELTGKENIFLYGSILGMSQREISSKYNEIVEFAGLREFINTPVKYYSSGMYVKLGFSVTAHTTPDILLIDEVLSVGDMAFQNKCLKKINEMRKILHGTVFVSHNMDHVRNLCTKVALIDQGKIIYYGDTEKAILNYFKLSRAAHLESLQRENPSIVDFGHLSTGDVVFHQASAVNAEGREIKRADENEDIRLCFDFETRRIIVKPSFSVGILNEKGEVCIWQMNQDTSVHFQPITPGCYRIRVQFIRPSLVPGAYYFTFAIRDSDSGESFERLRKNEHYFIVDGKSFPRGIVACASRWELNRRWGDIRTERQFYG